MDIGNSKPDRKTKADESPQVRKARRKLREKFKKEDERISVTAIEKMKAAINTWLTRHESDRTEVTAERWDANQHPALPKSKHVEELMQKLQNEEKKGPPSQKLKGRIQSK